MFIVLFFINILGFGFMVMTFIMIIKAIWYGAAKIVRLVCTVMTEISKDSRKWRKENNL